MASISEILISQGQLAAQARRTRGGQWAPLVQHLSQLPNQIAADRQAGRDAQEASFDRQQQRDVRGQQLAKGTQELEAAEATAEAKRQMQDLMSSDGVIGPDGTISVERGQEIARSKGYGDILPDFLTIAQGNNATIEKGGRERIQFDQQQTDRRQTTNQQGVRRMIGESVAARGGDPITPGERQTYQGMAFQEGVTLPAGLVPEDKPFTYGPLDNLMVNGRRTPVRTRSDGAVVDIRGNVIPDAQPDVPPNAGSQPGWQWVNRGGRPVHTNRPEPGDEPLRAPQNTGDTAQDRQRIARTTAAKDFLTRLNELRAKINTRMGPAAGISGYARRAGAAMGMDPDVAEYERIRAAGGRSLAVAIMGAQNLSDADAQAWANMLPDARTDEETAGRLTTQVERMLDGMTGTGQAAPQTQDAGEFDFDPATGQLIPRGGR